MSPEQSRGAKAVGPPTDVYALSMMLWELIAGRLPVDLDDQIALLELYSGRVPVPRLDEVAQCPSWLADVVARGLSRQPEARFADAGLLLAGLERMEEQAEVEAVAQPTLPVDADEVAEVAVVVGPSPLVAVEPAIGAARHDPASHSVVAAVLAALVIITSIVWITVRLDEAAADSEATACPATTWPCHRSVYKREKAACVVQASKDGGACGDKKGICRAGACVWTDTAGRKWGLVPAGTFQMGCNAALDTNCSVDEKPQHAVTISSSYWLGSHEVTVAEYKKCVTAGKCSVPKGMNSTCNWGKPGRGQHPINCVDWSQSHGYCAWAGGRLATEAEWELAARGRCDENGGTSTCGSKMRVYPWGNSAPVCGKQAVYSSGGIGCGAGTTWAVGTGSAQGQGPYGHYDLSGNVWEWVEDWYDGSFYKKTAATLVSPKNTTNSSIRVFRGGSFYNTTSFLRAGIRGYGTASHAFGFIGLRCVRSFP